MRTPKIAGSWYPDSAEEILGIIGDTSDVPMLPHPAVLMVPHAGYIFSGALAARAFAAVPAEEYDKVIVLAPSHRVAMLQSFSVEPTADVSTPFGTVKFSAELHDALDSVPGSKFVVEAHSGEHAVDILLPLVKRYLPDCRVAAAVVGQWDLDSEADAAALERFAAGFRRILDDRTIVVISTDFTHYGRNFGYVPFSEDPDVKLPRLDAEMFDAFACNDCLEWSRKLDETGATICGASCMQLVLAALPRKAEFRKLGYSNSAAVTRDWSNAVGYTTAAVFADWNDPPKPVVAPGGKDDDGLISDAAGQALLEIARQSLEAAVLRKDGDPGIKVSRRVSRELRRKRGAFVTLTKQGDLRGCIGTIGAREPLSQTVAAMARAAALDDYRFDPVRPGELADIEVEVSVLTEPKHIAGPEEIVIGRDGVILQKNGRSAVFLPQVAPEQGWDVPTTLAHLSMKAGLPPNAWLAGATFLTFQAQIFN